MHLDAPKVIGASDRGDSPKGQFERLLLQFHGTFPRRGHCGRMVEPSHESRLLSLARNRSLPLQFSRPSSGSSNSICVTIR